MMALEHADTGIAGLRGALEEHKSPDGSEDPVQNFLNDPNINIELEQGRSSTAGKLQYALLKQSTPSVYCSYLGQAARHMNQIGEDHILVVNSEHKVDVFKRGDARKVKTLDIEYMRYSLVVEDLLYIGTEEKMLYLVDALTFEILDRIMTQSYIFTMCRLDINTIICGEYQGNVDVIKVHKHEQLLKVSSQKLLHGNIYKIIKTDRPNEYCFGCGNGMYFATYENDKFALGDDKIFQGKYVT